MRRGPRLFACAGAVAVSAALAPAAWANPAVPTLDWQACGDAGGVQCATADVPRNYDKPDGKQWQIAVAKVPAKDAAHRIGSLFFNFGGPGGPAVDYLEATAGKGLFDALNQRFDIVAFDPRGVGQSSGAIDCKADQEKEGVYSEPFPTPLNVDAGALLRKDIGYIGKCLANNPGVLPYVTTGNVARDLDRLRQAVGDDKLNYLGFSYGTFLGATYASLFPRNFRALVLDGPVDATNYINDPHEDLVEQTAGFERALGRFLQACAADQTACSNFGGKDPWDALDTLIEQADAKPIPAAAYTPDPRPVKGDDFRAAISSELYAKQLWPELGAILAAAAKGNGSGIRQIVDEDFYGRNPDGTFNPGLDRYFTIGAVEQRYPRNLATYLRWGDESWGTFDHFYWNTGYVELNYGLYPVKPNGAFRGPFRVRSSAPTPLVVATTYDPATPYRGALRLVHDLGNARLLTMRGDGHTAYNGNSACVDAAVEAYLDDLTLPAAGTTCRQDVPFALPEVHTVQSLDALAQPHASRVHAQRPVIRR